MEIQTWQIIALTILSLIFIWDSLMTAVFDGKPIFAGILAGIIMGDVTTGLTVGATLQLMVLGVGTYGGSSMPDYVTGAIIGTAFAAISGRGIEFAIALAVPVGLLMVNIRTFLEGSVTCSLQREWRRQLRKWIWAQLSVISGMA